MRRAIKSAIRELSSEPKRPSKKTGTARKRSMPKGPSRRKVLQKAIAEGTTLLIVYRNAQGQSSTRNISPIAINDFHVKAHCHLRNEERKFRIDRIESIRPADLQNQGRHQLQETM